MSIDIYQTDWSKVKGRGGLLSQWFAYLILALGVFLSVSTAFVDLQIEDLFSVASIVNLYALENSLIFNKTIWAFGLVFLLVLAAFAAFFGTIVPAFVLSCLALLLIKLGAMIPLTQKLLSSPFYVFIFASILSFLAASIVRKKYYTTKKQFFTDSDQDLVNYRDIPVIGRSSQVGNGGHPRSEQESLEHIQKSLHEFARAANFNLAKFQRWRVTNHLFPDDEIAQINLARVLMEMQNYESALDLYYPLFHKYPERSSYWKAVVMCLIHLGRFGEAQRMIEKAKQDVVKQKDMDIVKASLVAKSNKKPAEE